MSPPSERVGVLVVNFGEPDEPVLENVQPFLEGIFLQNAGLEPNEAVLARARQLAADRAPDLIDEYIAIGGSPLNAQADAQTRALGRVLAERGWDVRAYSAFQFFGPTIGEKIAQARIDGVETLAVVPGYPICGQSTTVTALDAARAALAEQHWDPRFVGISGWHQHPGYVSLRVQNIRAFVAQCGLDLADPDTLLYFTVHGTPIKYLEEGNRYDRYVEEQCREIAAALGADRYGVGFQNHTNRRIAWTQPDNEDRIREAPEQTLVVVPISFMHEQSETLAELDHEMREFVEGLGKAFHRVPVPHDAPAFAECLADLVEGLISGSDQAGVPLARCRCAPWPGIRCTNGARDLPPSPYWPAGR